MPSESSPRNLPHRTTKKREVFISIYISITSVLYEESDVASRTFVGTNPVQQKTLLNLGAHFAIPKAQWAELVEIIEARLAGNEFLFEPAPELTATAEAIVQKLRSREMVQAVDETLMGDTAKKWTTDVRWDVNPSRCRPLNLCAFPRRSRMSVCQIAMHGLQWRW